MIKNLNSANSFMKETEYLNLTPSDQKEGLKQPPIELPFDELKLIDLPDPSICQLSVTNIRELIDERRTVRKYNDDALSLEELSYLLWSTQGVKKEVKNEEKVTHVTFRTVPSAGARHPFETYLLINQVTGITPGIYRYIATKHKLISILLEEDIASKVVKASYDQVFIGTSAITFIWSVDIYRTKWRYSERSYRYVFLDAGHICQNLYLSAQSIKVGVCAIGSYDDQNLNTLLGLDGENQFVVYMATAGKYGQ